MKSGCFCGSLLVSATLLSLLLDHAKANEEVERRLPQAIIIGVKKSGTRALLEFLRVHPDVRAPGPEVHFFDRYYDRGLDWYRSKMPPTTATQITVEKTPSYFITKNVATRIAETYQQNGTKPLRLILIVRDPIDRAVSDFVQTNSKYPEMAGRSFDDLALVTDKNGVKHVNTSWASIRIGVYYAYMQRWLHQFPIEQILVLSCEQLTKQPDIVINEVQSFLGLRPIITPDFFTIDPEKRLPCLTKRVYAKPDGSYTVQTRRKPHCLGRNKGRPHPTISNSTLNTLRNFYRPWNAKFFQQVGKRFDWF